MVKSYPSSMITRLIHLGDDRLPNGSWSKVPDLLCPAPSLAPPPFICLVPHPSTSAVLHTDFPPPLSRTLCRRSPPLSSARPPPPLPPLLTSSSSSPPPSRPPAPPPQAHGAIAVGGMSLPQTAAMADGPDGRFHAQFMGYS